MYIDLYFDRKCFTLDDHIYANQSEFIVDPDGRVGEGGNALVHECTNRITGESFAIKFQFNTSGNRGIRFSREIGLLQSLSHHQLMHYVAHGKTAFYHRNKTTNREVNGLVPFVIMPLAEQNLRKALGQRTSKMLYDEYIGQFKGLAEALAVLHSEAIHRDIKPENILVKGGTWILSDFGLCRFNDQGGEADITENDEPVGPRYWMSPEAVNRVVGNGDVIAKSSDVFQLASVFWYVVTGRHPTGIVTDQDWKGPSPVFEVLTDALSHDMRRRPQDGTAFLDRLNAATFA